MQNLILSERIKNRCKLCGIPVKSLLEECEMNRNTIYDLEKKSSFPSCDKISKISDYLDCSVDYLLGRTDVPEVNGRNADPKDSERILAEVLADIDEQMQINELIQNLKSKNAAQEPAPEFVKKAKSLLKRG